MITVSVCMITYNHENYIREAINGILMQETNFEYELIISNDASPDNTDEVVKEFIKNHPKGNLIEYHSHKNNLGIMPNLLFALEQCKGKYIAMCEGDDYWITKDKLQKQVDILEANQKLGLVYTGVKFFKQKEQEFQDIPSRFAKKKEDVIPMMLESKFIEFATTVFRSDVLSKVIEIIKPELKNAVIGDTRILMETAYQSDIHFLDEVTTVYRVAEGSASYPNNIDKYIFALLDTYKCRKTFVLRNNLNTKLLATSVNNTNKGLINNAFISKQYSKSFKCLKNLLIVDTIKYFDFKTFIKKITPKIFIKFLLSLLGIGVLIQNFKK